MRLQFFDARPDTRERLGEIVLREDGSLEVIGEAWLRDIATRPAVSPLRERATMPEEGATFLEALAEQYSGSQFFSRLVDE